MEKNIKTASKGVRSMYEWLEEIVFALVAVILVFTFLFRVVTVTGKSMLPNFVEGEKVVVTNLGHDIEQGTVVVVTNVLEEPIIKRVIAVGGQTLKIDFDTGEVYVDGVLQHEDYTSTPTTNPGDMEIPEVIPEGYVFVMGDNRNDSTDSRYKKVGLVDVNNILGKAQMVIFPFNRIKGL